MGVPISNSTFQALLQSPFCSVVRPSLTEAPRWRRAVSGLFLFSREVPFFGDKISGSERTPSSNAGSCYPRLTS